MSFQNNAICEYALLNKMIDASIQSSYVDEHSKRFAILLNILIEIVVNPAFAKYHTLCETLFYNNYHYVNMLLQDNQIVNGEQDYEMIRQVICLIKEEMIGAEGANTDNKKIVEKLIVYYCD